LHGPLILLQNPPFSNLQTRLNLLKLNVINPVDGFGSAAEDFREPTGFE
jgi:hypothetical protein